MVCEAMRDECKAKFADYEKIIAELKSHCNKDCKDCKEIIELKDYIKKVDTKVDKIDENLNVKIKDFDVMLRNNHSQWESGNDHLTERVDSTHTRIDGIFKLISDIATKLDQPKSKEDTGFWGFLSKNKKIVLCVTIPIVTAVVFLLFSISYVVLVHWQDLIKVIAGQIK